MKTFSQVLSNKSRKAIFISFKNSFINADNGYLRKINQTYKFNNQKI